MAEEKPWYWSVALPPDHLPADGKPYRTSLPCEPYQCFNLDGCLCCTYIENGVKKAARFEPPNRFYPMDPWVLEWGDIAGVAYPQLINSFSWGLKLALSAGPQKAKRKKKIPPEGRQK
jgi:hypothetical protein